MITGWMASNVIFRITGFFFHQRNRTMGCIDQDILFQASRNFKCLFEMSLETFCYFSDLGIFKLRRN